MNSIKVNPIIKDNNIWTIENKSSNIQLIKDTYLNKFVTDGTDVLHVSKIKFTPTGIDKTDYVIDLIDDDDNISNFFKL